jgi:hypothetical protein
VSLVAQEAATWPETGIGLLYSKARDARVCLSSSAYYYVAVHAGNIAGTKAMTMGDIVLTPGFSHYSRAQLGALIAHEARHRAQWAVGTVVGGPFTFPVAYAIDDFFFPGPRNHFERLAGLKEGGYGGVGTGPVLGPAQLAILVILAAAIVVTLLVAWRRRPSGRHRPASLGTGRWPAPPQLGPRTARVTLARAAPGRYRGPWRAWRAFQAAGLQGLRRCGRTAACGRRAAAP